MCSTMHAPCGECSMSRGRRHVLSSRRAASLLTAPYHVRHAPSPPGCALQGKVACCAAMACPRGVHSSNRTATKRTTARCRKVSRPRPAG